MTSSRSGGGRKSPTKKFAKDTKFACPKCGTSVQVHIKLEFRPVCTRHAGGTTQMEETQ